MRPFTSLRSTFWVLLPEVILFTKIMVSDSRVVESRTSMIECHREASSDSRRTILARTSDSTRILDSCATLIMVHVVKSDWPKETLLRRALYPCQIDPAPPRPSTRNKHAGSEPLSRTRCSYCSEQRGADVTCRHRGLSEVTLARVTSCKHCAKEYPKDVHHPSRPKKITAQTKTIKTNQLLRFHAVIFGSSGTCKNCHHLKKKSVHGQRA
jgi:hypothetical protein